MAEGNPQLEEGHIRIANELFDALLSADLSKRQMKIILAVMRNTYGWSRNTAPCSLSWLAGKTRLDPAHCSRGVAELATMGLLKRQEGAVQVLGINKHYEEWRGCQKSNPSPCQNGNGLPKEQQKGCRIGTGGVAKTATIKDREQQPGIKTERTHMSTGRGRGLIKISPFLENPPGTEEVQAYLTQINAPFTAQDFFDGMTNCQWTHSGGKHPVVDWRATVRTWTKVRMSRGPSSTRGGQANYERLL